MTFVRAMRAIASKWHSTEGFSTAPLRLVDLTRTPNTGQGSAPGDAEFPDRPLAFLWHYMRRRPLLHAAALVSVVGAASFACIAQFGLKLIVDARAAGQQQIVRVWWALALFAVLLAGESMLWRSGSWFGYRAILADKAEAKLDLFNHLSGHSSRYFSDRMGGSLANRISAAGDSLQQVSSTLLFNIAPVCADFCAALAMLATVDWHLVAALFVFVLLAASTLARLSQRGMARHRLYADHAADVGGMVGIKPVPRHAALAQPGKRARGQQNENEEGSDQMPIYRGQHRQRGAKIGTYWSNIEQQGRGHLLQRIPGGGDAIGKRAAHSIGKISAAVAAQMIEQVELGFRLVRENCAVAEPAAGAPQHA